jgi:prephenate dehydrogenase
MATPPAAHRIDKLLVLGVGLIGGSFALAQKAAGAAGMVVGVGRGRVNLEEAANLGIIDRAVPLDGKWTQELATTDIVLMAAPVAQYRALFDAMAPHLGPHTIVTDAGSTKQDVIAAARATLGAALPRFVPGHPIAGTEQSGAAAAFSTLYAERNVVLTPMPETDPLALATVAAAWQTCGARVRTLDAATHDRVFAAVSHLPHVLAFALVDELAARPDAEELFRFAASGFRDFTRIAASSPEMWRDVALANRDAIMTEIAAYRRQLDRIAALVAAGDGAGLEALFGSARAARRAWDARRNAAGGRVPEDGPREP